MANPNLFRSDGRGALAPAADTTNPAGGVASALDPKAALAQYVVTGVFGNTFYTSAGEDLTRVFELVQAVMAEDPEFVAKLAIYGRKIAGMKDTPAFLVTALFVHDYRLASRVFPAVINGAGMLRNFVQILRSGQLCRKSLGTAGRRMIETWFNSQPSERIFRGSIGKNPSLGDVVKLAHPRPGTKAQANLYRYLIGKPLELSGEITTAEAPQEIPGIIHTFEAWKRGDGPMPNLDFRHLDGARKLTQDEWCEIASNGKYIFTIKNLSTFMRHGVFEDEEMVHRIADRISDVKLVKQSKVFPTQILMAYLYAKDSVPVAVTDALHDAMEAATLNVPALNGPTLVIVDTSASMANPLTERSRARCVDIAALLGASVLRKNPKTAKLIGVDLQVNFPKVSGRDTVMTTAGTLGQFAGGATRLGAALEWLAHNPGAVNVILISDNESWAGGWNSYRNVTECQQLFSTYRLKYPTAKLACIDVAPNATTQAKESPFTLNVGGWNDRVFDVVGKFFNGVDNGGFVDTIDKLEI